MFQRGGGVLGRDVQPRRLRRHARLRLGRVRQQEKGPEQRHRRRLVPGEDQGRHLVSQFRARKSVPGFRIARRAQQVEQVARRFWLRRGQPGGDDAIHEAHPPALEEITRDVAREHRPPCDFQRQGLHCRQQVHRSGQPGQGVIGRGHHVAQQQRQAARGKGRGHGAPLQAPGLTLAQQQAVADDRAQDPHRGGAAPVAVWMLHQHVADVVRPVQQDHLPAQHRHDGDLLLIRPRRPHAQRVAAREAHALPKTGLRRGRFGGGGTEHRGHHSLFFTDWPAPLAEPLPMGILGRRRRIRKGADV